MAVSYDTPQIQAANFGGIGNAALTTANTAKDGTGTVVTIFTAGADGSILNRIRYAPAGTNVPSVLRIWINDGVGLTATDSILWRERDLPATTLTEVASQLEYVIECGLKLPAGYRVLCAIGTSVAAGWYVSAEGGDY